MTIKKKAVPIGYWVPHWDCAPTSIIKTATGRKYMGVCRTNDMWIYASEPAGGRCERAASRRRDNLTHPNHITVTIIIILTQP